MIAATSAIKMNPTIIVPKAGSHLYGKRLGFAVLLKEERVDDASERRDGGD